MTRQIILRSPAVNRRQPLLNNNSDQTPKGDEKHNHRIGEVAGGTAAGCAAICCCCPCAVVNLLVLAVYKVPVGLCKKAWRKKKRQRMMKKKKKQEQLLQTEKNGGGPTNPYDESTAEIEELEVDGGEGSSSAVDMEKEMWDHFYGAGFWRSPSQRDN